MERVYAFCGLWVLKKNLQVNEEWSQHRVMVSCLAKKVILCFCNNSLCEKCKEKV